MLVEQKLAVAINHQTAKVTHISQVHYCKILFYSQNYSKNKTDEQAQYYLGFLSFFKVSNKLNKLMVKKSLSAKVLIAYKN